MGIRESTTAGRASSLPRERTQKRAGEGERQMARRTEGRGRTSGRRWVSTKHFESFCTRCVMADDGGGGPVAIADRTARAPAAEE